MLKCLVVAVVLASLLPFTVAGQETEPIAELQALLAARNCNPGPADGAWGRRTQRALDAFNKQAGLNVERPITGQEVSAVAASSAQCSPFLGMSIAEAARTIEPRNIAGWNREKMLASAGANRGACGLGGRTDWVGPLELQQDIEVVGDDLAMYKAITDALLVDMNRMIASAAAGQGTDKLKALMVDLAANGYFTRLKPYRPTSWEGTRPDWVAWYAENIPEAEPAFNAAMILIPASIAYSLLAPELTEEERAAFRAWGDRVYALARDAKKDGMRSAADRRGAGDRRAAYAAGFLAWGGATQNADAFLRGAELFEEGVRRIRSDGTERGFVEGQDNSGLELKYQNFAYGLLAVAAYVLEQNGIPAFAYSDGSSGTLADGIAFHLEATQEPAKRKRMVKDQDLDYAASPRNWGANSLAYLPLVAAAGALDGRDELLAPYFDMAAVGFPRGFAGDYYGGFTSCLFGGTGS